MTEEEKHLLERAVALGEENNRMLRGMRRAGRFALVWKAVYWVLILGLSYGAYVYVQPYVDQLLKTYQEATGVVTKVGNAASKLPDFQKALGGGMR